MPDLDLLIEQAEDEHAESGVYALSVFCGIMSDTESDEDVVVRVVEEAKIPNGQIRLARVGDLTKLGFTLAQTGEPDCHYDVDLGAEPTAELVGEFEQAFGPPRRNPCR